MISDIFLYFFCGPVAIFALTVVIIRTRIVFGHPLEPQKSCFLAGLLFGFILIIFYGIAFRAEPRAEFWAGILYCCLYSFCLNFLNWFLFTITEISMHIHLLVEIVESGGLTRKKMQERYNKQIVLGVRIPRLLELGQIRILDERYYLTGRWVLLGGQMCTLLRRIVGLPAEPEREQ